MIESITEAFLGKVCTIFTNSIPITFKDGFEYSKYFTGEVTRVDPFGIWIRHPQFKTLAFFSFPVVGIVEEQFIPKEDPRASKISEELKKVPTKPIPGSSFIDVSELTESFNKVKGKKVNKEEIVKELLGNQQLVAFDECARANFAGQRLMGKALKDGLARFRERKDAKNKI